MLLINNQLPTTRHGLSLVEVLIAMVMTLVVLGAMMAAFSYGSGEMQRGRATIELNNRLISAEEQLRRDLDRITVELKPHHRASTFPKGYVEIVDGPQTDGFADADVDGVADAAIFGDRDDYFSCTIKSDGNPFRGRLGNQIVESHLAEVVWFAVPDDATADTTDFLLVRRQLLILPGITLPNFGINAGTPPETQDYTTFLQQNDVSIRVTGTAAASPLQTNSVEDLAFRGNRFAHFGFSDINPASSTLSVPANTLVDPHFGLWTLYNENHVLASQVAAFDIQVFAPDASVRTISDGGGMIVDIIEPSDVGTSAGAGVATSISGAYVDLGKGDTNGTRGIFGGNPSVTTPAYTEAVYDTGTSFYNRTGANNLASNGVDDSPAGTAGAGIVDSSDEQFAVAPYNAPIRGLKFTMRVIEPITKQVRQLSVKKSFVPES